jgi:hypothetical protein
MRAEFSARGPTLPLVQPLFRIHLRGGLCHRWDDGVFDARGEKADFKDLFIWGGHAV